MFGDLTFSEQPGFVREGNDVSNMLTINHAALDHVSVVNAEVTQHNITTALTSR